MVYFLQRKESVELAIQLQGKKIQGREIRIQRLKSKANTKTLVTRKPMSFKKTTTKPPGDRLNYQGVMELKTQKKVIFFRYYSSSVEFY